MATGAGEELIGVLGRKVGERVECLHCGEVFELRPEHWQPFEPRTPDLGCFECPHCEAGEGDLFLAEEGGHA